MVYCTDVKQNKISLYKSCRFCKIFEPSDSKFESTRQNLFVNLFRIQQQVFTHRFWIIKLREFQRMVLVHKEVRAEADPLWPCNISCLQNKNQSKASLDMINSRPEKTRSDLISVTERQVETGCQATIETETPSRLIWTFKEIQLKRRR